jgi:hypothetical protein
MVRPRKTSDGRANSGGARQGTPGQPYPNRSDLRAQKPTAVPNQGYGQAGAQLAAQKVVPMAGAPPPPVPAAPAPRQMPGAGGFATPEDTPTLIAPTQRPDEPLTAGLPFGPGPGPEALGPPPMNDTEARLRALYAAYPTPELRDLIRQIDMSR